MVGSAELQQYAALITPFVFQTERGSLAQELPNTNDCENIAGTTIQPFVFHDISGVGLSDRLTTLSFTVQPLSLIHI